MNKISTKTNTNTLSRVRIAAISIGVAAVVFVAHIALGAWTPPTSSPPGGNVSTPLNVSSTTQTKTGNLGVASFCNTSGNCQSANDLISSLTRPADAGLTFSILQVDSVGDVRINDTSGITQIVFDANGGNSYLSQFTGNFGIGLNGPGNKLSVLSAQNRIATFSTFANGFGSIWIGSPDGDLEIKAGANAEIFVDDAKRLEINGTTGLVSTFGNLTVNNGTGKLTVGTIDPIYTIEGNTYATYMAAMIGVKEETTGTLILKNNGAGEYEQTINFENARVGSDLWLFSKTTNLAEQFEEMVVLLTPGFEGTVWYTKEATLNELTIHALPANKESAVEVSYRLTAPRFDAAAWGNEAVDGDSEGFNLDEF